MLGNVRIPAALSLVVGAGLALSLAIAAAGGGCAYTASRLAQLLLVEARRSHDAIALDMLASLQRSAHVALASLAALSICSVLVAVIARHWLNRKVVHPLDGAMGVVNAIALGDLRGPIVIDERTQARRLFSALLKMRQALIATLSLVTSEAVAIDDRAADLASENQRLAAGAETQAAAIEETAATTQEISAGIDRIAGLAAHTNRLAGNASTLATASSERVHALIDAIASITQHSKRISQVVSVVNDLAFQTNILALNAAVEAARAGHQGKGFAVVASEVRTLAQRSANAAREIDELIAHARATIEQGASLCADAGSAMDGVVAAAREVLDLSDGMSRSASEQSLGVQQLNGAIMEIDRVTQQNTRMVQLFVEATDDVSGRASALAHAVEAWKLG